MSEKRKDSYAGWTHDDFEKEAGKLEKSINRSIDKINSEYKAGKRPDMDGPIERVRRKSR